MTTLRRERERDDYGLGAEELDLLRQGALGERDEDESDPRGAGPLGMNEDVEHPWSVEAVNELLRRLNREAGLQATLIREAAAGDRTVSRSRVYELAGYPKERTLRGLTRPVRRLTAELAGEGLVSPGAVTALRTIYPPGGVRAVAFQVPGSVARALRDG